VHLGADINLRNNQGMTALHMAAQLGLIKVVKTLI
jgi:ankyrin repeat protein